MGCALLYLIHTSAGSGFAPGVTTQVKVAHLAGHWNENENLFSLKKFIFLRFNTISLSKMDCDECEISVLSQVRNKSRSISTSRKNTK